MEYWKYRISTLRLMNILYLTILVWFEYIYIIEDQTSRLGFLGIVFIGVILLSIVFLLSFVKKLHGYYQSILSIMLWFITIVLTNMCLMTEYTHTQLVLFILLLVAIFSVFNRKVILQVAIVYLMSVMPIVIVSPFSFGDKIEFAGVILILMFLAFLKSTYEFNLFKAYETSNKYQFFLLENAQEAFALHEILLNEQGEPINYRFVEVNKAFEQLTGLARENILNKTVLDILPDTEFFWIKEYGEVVLLGIQKNLVHFSNEFNKWFEVTAYPVSKSQFGVLFTDISDQLDNERKLRNAIKLSENSIQLKNQFLRDVNHRLRTPLNGMMGMMQLIDSNELNGENKELFEAMALEMKHSRNIINQISKYIEIQNKQLEYKRYNVFDILTHELAELNRDNSIVSCREGDIYTKTYYVEKSVLTSVFKELMTNAILHTKNEEIFVDIELTQMEQVTSQVLLSISVTDYGEGMSDEQLKFVFNEFYHHDFISVYREDDRISLPMCKQLLKSCGGDLLVVSELGHHTRFTMILPVYLSEMLI